MTSEKYKEMLRVSPHSHPMLGNPSYADTIRRSLTQDLFLPDPSPASWRKASLQRVTLRAAYFRQHPTEH